MTDRYHILNSIGEGTFAKVYKAVDLQSEKIVAMKQIKLAGVHESKEGVNHVALREIKLLQELQHQNIIELLDVVGDSLSITLVFDIMSTDLEIVIKNRKLVFLPQHIKGFLLQILLGVEFLHHNWMLHRDLKPNNVLISHEGVLKLTDFGLARTFASPTRNYTPNVVTLWYRSPELLLSARSYGVGVDIWAVGCIFAELMKRDAFIAAPENTDISQLTEIYRVLGTPNEDEWPELSKLNYVKEAKPRLPLNLQDTFKGAASGAFELMMSMLVYNPLKRVTASQALQHEYFSLMPAPAQPQDLPLPEKDKVAPTVPPNLPQREKRKRTFFDDDD